MGISPLLHGEINFIDLKEETVKPSLCHSYRSPFKGQVIALPSHGQNTAAVKHIVTGQAGPLICYLQEAMFLVNRRGLVFAEFLLFLLVFPCKHTGVRLTVWYVEAFLVIFLLLHYPLVLGPLMFDVGSFRCTLVQGEGLALLLLILALSLP